MIWYDGDGSDKSERQCRCSNVVVVSCVSLDCFVWKGAGGGYAECKCGLIHTIHDWERCGDAEFRYNLIVLMNIATHTPHNNIDVVGFFAANNVLFFSGTRKTYLHTRWFIAIFERRHMFFFLVMAGILMMCWKCSACCGEKIHRESLLLHRSIIVFAVKTIWCFATVIFCLFVRRFRHIRFFSPFCKESMSQLYIIRVCWMMLRYRTWCVCLVSEWVLWCMDCLNIRRRIFYFRYMHSNRWG